MRDELRTEPSCSAEAGAALDFFRLALGFWSGPSARSAWGLGSAIGLLLLLNLAVNLGFNHWQRWFFDALEQKRHGVVLLATGLLAVLILLGAAFAVAMVRCRMGLQVRWRQWTTTHLIAVLGQRITRGGGPVPTENHGSPAYRIAEDIRLALDPIVDLAIGFGNATILGVSFAGILIAVGGDASFQFAGMSVRIPAYLAFAALTYAVLVSLLMYLVGQPLVRRLAEKSEAEARFLFELNTAAEAVAAQVGAPLSGSLRPARLRFNATIRSWHHVITEYGRLTWISNAHSYFAPILPLLLTAPKYTAGELTLGAVMQLVTAFTVVLGALNWFADNFVRIAEWSASARRVDELHRALHLQ